jgi:regulatory protein
LTVVTLKESAGAVFRIGLSDGSLFSFKSVYLPSSFQNGFAPEPGQEISSDDENAYRFAASCYRAEKLALRLIARAEQNSRGLARKLEQRKQEPAPVKAVLNCLMETGILDDKRYAELWVRSRLARLSGTPRRLAAGLAARGIDRDTAGQALKATLDRDHELALLKTYLRKKKLAFDDNRGAEYRSLKYHLKGEGFSGAVLECLLEEAE